MSRSIMICLLGATVIALTACNAPAPAGDPAAGEAAIRTLDEQWSSTAAKNDVDRTVAFYTDDAVLLAPNSPMASDKKAIRAAWGGLLGPGASVAWKPTKIEVAKSGDLGYLYGTYTLDMHDPKGGPAVHDVGKILEVWKKQADGNWKCIVDTYNSDLPLAK